MDDVTYLPYTVDMDGVKKWMIRKGIEEYLPAIWEIHPSWHHDQLRERVINGDREGVKSILEELGRCMTMWYFKECHMIKFTGDPTKLPKYQDEDEGSTVRIYEINEIYHPIGMATIQEWWIGYQGYYEGGYKNWK